MKAQWEHYRDVRIQKLKESLGAWPEPPKDMQIVVTRELPGDGFGKRIAIWGDSFAKPNAKDARFALPLDAPDVPRPCGTGWGATRSCCVAI